MVCPERRPDLAVRLLCEKSLSGVDLGRGIRARLFTATLSRYSLTRPRTADVSSSSMSLCRASSIRSRRSLRSWISSACSSAGCTLSADRPARRPTSLEMGRAVSRLMPRPTALPTLPGVLRTSRFSSSVSSAQLPFAATGSGLPPHLLAGAHWGGGGSSCMVVCCELLTSAGVSSRLFGKCRAPGGRSSARGSSGPVGVFQRCSGSTAAPGGGWKPWSSGSAAKRFTCSVLKPIVDSRASGLTKKLAAGSDWSRAVSGDSGGPPGCAARKVPATP
mmetsp:Transcript_27793/g.60266  ORF Transcript_27793/g.60266 Transcript_27793/m.60266 type:complete len:276 (-) Transcript_27793:334-1161(-)